MFSIGFKSGDSGDVFHQVTLFLSKNFSICLLRCFVSLSCCKWWPSEKYSLRKGIKEASRSFAYLGAFIIPVNITILVAPLVEMPPQICTFAGCFDHCFSARGSSFFLKHNLLWWSNWMVDYQTFPYYQSVADTTLSSWFYWLPKLIDSNVGGTDLPILLSHSLHSCQGNIQTWKLIT